MYMSTFTIHINEFRTIRSHKKVIWERELYSTDKFDLAQQPLKWDVYMEFCYDEVFN